MLKPLRRLDDAACAFLTGHSRRDLDRVRLRRLKILVRREIARLEREAREHEYYSFRATFCRSLAQSLASRLEGVVNRVDGESYRILLDHLHIERINLHARRKFQWDDWHSLDDFDKARIHCPVMPVIDPTGKQYGKLFEGLGDCRIFDPFHDKGGFRIRHWHRVLAPFFRWRARPLQRVKVSGPP
ncbi:hypothetical protein FHS76_003483 [Ochrobactrum daejeonense]|uniref:Uncharacterized protein n=1 Tax=Brucella daejeonensis TaxID=659015 RepID=A0A7W9EPA0_9HYPH|nr:hypothetical protein [Brucella daejeonensis]MBB5703576.1 hypothetical protein [Brucella daejeonensis]